MWNTVLPSVVWTFTFIQYIAVITVIARFSIYYNFYARTSRRRLVSSPMIRHCREFLTLFGSEWK